MSLSKPSLRTLSWRDRQAVRVIDWCITHLPSRELSEAITEALSAGTVQVLLRHLQEWERSARPNA